jgi:hypothetical protein
MHIRRLRSRHWNLVLALGCVAAIGGLACGGSERRNAGSGGASGGEGGATGSGGAGQGGVGHGGSGSGGMASGGAAGGSSGSGGITSGGVSGGGSGGSSEGGAGGGAGGSSQGGAGGTTVITTCTSGSDCSSDSPFCEMTFKICAACLKTSDCASGGHCLGNQCVSFASCGNTRDCGTDEVCDPARGLCVQCFKTADCSSGQDCVNYACVAVQSCQDTSECGSKVCDTDKKKCVECAGDGDCKTSDQKCVQNLCRAACTSDKNCTSQGMLCDSASSVCVQCLGDGDCPASAYCEAGVCKPDVCDSTQSTCSGDGVAACNAAGSGWGSVTACSSSQPCKAQGGLATCGGTVPPDGGNPPLDGGNPPDDGGPTDTPIAPTCTTDTIAPCTTIPKFTGNQTLDGKGDDMCSVPSFTFTKTAAAQVNNYNNIPDAQFETVTARVAWSPAGLHAFFEVTDADVQTVYMKDTGTAAVDRPYQGDSIELFISSSDTVTGLTASDNNTIHVTLPASGPAVLVKTSSGGSAVHTVLPTTEYSQEKTATGYAIEVKLSWPGDAPSGGGRARFDLALNSADSICTGVDDMRDAQMVFYLGEAGGSTSCPGAPEAWCDDRTWCSTTLGQ